MVVFVQLSAKRFDVDIFLFRDQIIWLDNKFRKDVSLKESYWYK